MSSEPIAGMPKGSGTPGDLDPGGYDAGFPAPVANDALGRLNVAHEVIAFQSDLLSQVPDAVFATDAAFRVMYWNAAAERLFGWSIGEVVGRLLEDVFPARPESGIEAGLGQLLEREQCSGTVSCMTKRGCEVEVEVTAKVFCDAGGNVLHVVGSCRDVTGKRQAEADAVQHLKLHRALAEIDELIHVSFCRGNILEEILPKAVEGIGATGAVVAMRESKQWRVKHVFGEVDDVVDTCIPLEEAPFAERVRQTGKVVVVEDTSATREARRSGLGRLSGARAMILTPLVSCGALSGVVVFIFGETHLPSEHELSFASRLSASLGLALANVQLYETERAVAEKLQDCLLAVPTQVPGVSFSTAYRSSSFELGRVGGDFLDVFEVHKDLVAFVLGDVSGKGLESAATTSLIRTTLRVHAVDGLPPRWVMMKANEVVRRFTDSDTFITLWLGLLDTKSGLLTYIAAGHPPPVVVPTTGDLRLLYCDNPILGAFDHASYVEVYTVLDPGDRLVLYSDGVTEARSPDGEFYEIEGLLNSLEEHRGEQATRMADRLMDGVLAFSDGVLRDDVAVMVVEPTGLRRTGGQRLGKPRLFAEE